MENSQYHVDSTTTGFDIIEPDRNSPRTGDYDLPPDILFKDVREEPTITVRVFDEAAHEADKARQEQAKWEDMRYTQVDDSPIDTRKSKTIEILTDKEISHSGIYTHSHSNNLGTDQKSKKRKTHRKRPFIKPPSPYLRKAFPGQLPSTHAHTPSPVKRNSPDQTQSRSHPRIRIKTTTNTNKMQNKTLPEQDEETATMWRRGPPPEDTKTKQSSPPSHQVANTKPYTREPREEMFFKEKELDQKIRLNTANMVAQEHQYRQELRRVLLEAISQNALKASEKETRLGTDREQERRLETLNVLLSPHVTSMISDLFSSPKPGQPKDPQGNYGIFRH